MRRFTIDEIARALGTEAQGDGAVTVTHAAEPEAAGPEALALAMDPKYGEGLAASQAQAAVLWDGADWKGFGLKAAILVPRARLAMAGLTAALDPGPQVAPGLHPSAVIDPSAEIAEGAAIGPFTVIGAGVRIGPGARILGQATIAEGSQIGADLLLFPGVRIGRNVRIGDRFIAHPNVVIGADGFSFVTAEKSRAEAARETLGDASGAEAQPWLRIHSLGGVVIGDDVEIGANSCIDAGTIRPTRVGSGTKLDNQVQIGHNCEIGRDCLFAGQTGAAGSARIGNNVVLGGRVAVADNIFVGDGVVAGGTSGIASNVPAGRVVMGSPAVKMDSYVDTYKVIRRLPRLAADVAALKEALKKAVSKPGSSD